MPVSASDGALRARLSKVGILGPLLSCRDFRLLWSGLVVSLFGDGIFLVAIAWQAYALSDRATALAWVGVAASVPQLALLPFGGAFSDRLARRSVLVASDLVRGLAVGLLAVSGFGGWLRLWQLWAAAFVIGAGNAFAAPAFDSIVPELVPKADLQRANALDQFLRPAALQLLGPAVGGAIVAAAGTSTAFGLDAASFFFSAVFVSFISSRRRHIDASEAPESVLRTLRRGLGYVRGHVWLWGTFLSAALTYLLFLGPTQVLIPYLIKNELHGSAGALGTVLGIGGAGALLAAAIVGQRSDARHPVVFMYAAWTGATLAVAGYGLATREWELALVAFGAGALEAAGAVVWSTLKQRLVPIALMGRVSSIDWFVSMALMPLSYALTPVAVHFLGIRNTFIWAGTLGAAVTAAFLFLPGMRANDRPTGAPPGEQVERLMDVPQP